jgi:hypothetical protein
VSPVTERRAGTTAKRGEGNGIEAGAERETGVKTLLTTEGAGTTLKTSATVTARGGKNGTIATVTTGTVTNTAGETLIMRNRGEVPKTVTHELFCTTRPEMVDPTTVLVALSLFIYMFFLKYSRGQHFQ